MAKIIPGNIAPDSYPHVRGVFYTRENRGQIVAQAWPRKRGRDQHPNSVWTFMQWAYAARWSANAFPVEYQTAIEMTRGTDWMPRDLLTRAAFGKAYEIVNPDGSVWAVDPHSPPPPQREPFMQWQFNQFDNAYSTVSTFVQAAFKGNIFRPHQAMQIAAAQAIYTPVISGTYRMILATLDVSNVITALAQSSTQVATTTERRWREFDLEATLQPGGTYALMIGRTDGGNLYSIPLAFNTAPKWLFPVSSLGSARLANQAPAIGMTVANPDAFSPFFGIAASF